MSDREIVTFDPDNIRIALERNLPEGLRALADAIEAKQIDGRLTSIQGNGFVHWRDTRAHLKVVLDIAAEVFQWRGGVKIPLDASPQIALPAATPEVAKP